MNITFLEAEFVKRLCSESILGYKTLKKTADASGSIAAIMGFLGQDMTEEQAELVMVTFKEQCMKAQELIGRINEEYGLNT